MTDVHTERWSVSYMKEDSDLIAGVLSGIAPFISEKEAREYAVSLMQKGFDMVEVVKRRVTYSEGGSFVSMSKL